MFRTIGDQPSLWESVLLPEVLRLPEELARVGALLDDPAVFFGTVGLAWLGALGHQVVNWRHSSGERRQQLK